MVSDVEHDVTFTVPSRFGTRTVLAVTALIGLLLTVARLTALPTLFIVFYSTFLALICVAQMVFARSPRLACVLSGAVFVPAMTYFFRFMPHGSEGLLEQVMPGLDTNHRDLWLIVIGGFLGYLGGTVLAGVFLLAECCGPARPKAKEQPSEPCAQPQGQAPLSLAAAEVAAENHADDQRQVGDQQVE